MPRSNSNPAEFRPARESSIWIPVILIVAILAGAFGWWYWSQRKPSAPESLAASAPPPAAPLDAPLDGLPQASLPPVTSGPQNPVERLAPPERALPALNDADTRVGNALYELLGHKAVVSFLQVDGFVRRVVATVDNLPRQQATPRLWPAHATPQRFAVQDVGDERTTISPDNGSRYAPFVLFAESIDIPRAAALYARFYPLFQSAYEELGYPGVYFNDRLVAVIDHLLRAPEPAGPVEVRLPVAKGGEPLEHPWLHYEFADPRLNALSAGQKILIRMGPVNERRVKARLTELRRVVATRALKGKPS
jgi:hypothetical protein